MNSGLRMLKVLVSVKCSMQFQVHNPIISKHNIKIWTRFALSIFLLQYESILFRVARVFQLFKYWKKHNTASSKGRRRNKAHFKRTPFLRFRRQIGNQKLERDSYHSSSREHMMEAAAPPRLSPLHQLLQWQLTTRTFQRSQL